MHENEYAHEAEARVGEVASEPGVPGESDSPRLLSFWVTGSGSTSRSS